MPDEIKPPVQVDVAGDKIKRAVKEALDDKRMDDLSDKMIALSTQMATGFSAVHTRQDVANGRLMKHETRLDVDEEKIRLLQQNTSIPTFWQRNQDKIVWGVIVTGLMLFYFLLVHAGFPKFLGN
jgi:hypothetical protein